MDGRYDSDIVGFDAEEKTECRTGLFLAVGAVAGVDEEGGGEEAVAGRGADATAGYGGEGSGCGLGFC